MALLNVVVLGPLAIVAALVSPRASAALALGAWTLLVWVRAAVVRAPVHAAEYDATMRDDVLPLVLGLTGDAGYARASRSSPHWRS